MTLKNTPLFMLVFWILSTMAWWGVAFAPYGGGDVPEWFLAAKNACFGTLANGLPDTSGWLLLTLSPLSFLAGLFIAWPNEIKKETMRFLSVRSGRVFTSVLVLVLVVEAGLVTREIKRGLAISSFNFSNDSQEDLPEAYPRTYQKIADFELVDQEGHMVRLSSLKGEIVVLTFAFAHCATVCPTLVYRAKKGFLEAGTDGVRLLVITLDPWRDRPSTLPTLAEKWKLPPSSHILSGDVEVVNKTIKELGVTTSRNLTTGEVVHPSIVYIIDQSGRIAFTFNDAPYQWITQAIGRLKKIELAETRN